MTNMCIQSYGIEESIKIVATFCLSYTDGGRPPPIISVGSGTAELEYLVQTATSNKIEWICVDPNPTSFILQGKKIFIEPAYKYVDDLVRSRPDVVGKCLLFLNWCSPGNSEYDMEAVKLLQPAAILTTIDFHNGGAGAAGGFLFHSFLKSKSYNTMFSTKLYYKPLTPGSVIDIEGETIALKPYELKFIWLQNPKLYMNKVSLPTTYESKILHPHKKITDNGIFLWIDGKYRKM
jgi:hypothetical protein